MAAIETDLLVIGGGINGTGIAADAAGRGLSVVLCEQDDLAAHTSSASTKLIHGGLRYLEQCEFRLVHEALKEREILMQKAPHLIHPLRFILPYHQKMRPAWMIRLGLFLYDLLAKRRILKPSRRIRLKKELIDNPLKSSFSLGFSYTDCMTDDARLVILNALAAKEKGARILTRVLCHSAERVENHWRVECRDQITHKSILIHAKAIVNATGPWVSHTLSQVSSSVSRSGVKLIKGSHAVFPRLSPGEDAYVLQNTDERIVFVIPYLDRFSLVGTTDIVYQGDPKNPFMSDEEMAYLLDAVNRYFKKEVSRDDVVWSYSGVRALYDDHESNVSKITREYHLDIEECEGALPLLSVFGGKITTFRTLAEHALERLKPYFPGMRPSWTASSVLPGGDFKGLRFEQFVEQLKNRYPWLPKKLRLRYAKQYGSRVFDVISHAASLKEMGKNFGEDFYSREIDYLILHEWALTVEDILWRRTKMGLYLSQKQVEAVQCYLDELIVK